ncbi:(2Fe-2S) ferredoxin domain-containing protein [Sphingobium sufflavum]|uniref:(2Fe-2S) ferredoxin domain-containing protein n=1 Tax=Sphingobium sufflavum TaxID=1129547 RepID=UPI001F170D85|nr:(2Fe-2S) ferredoxin domain-containing protein [Sphingobium sufflavum]MCE7797097.1 (2Fe-2S) ferredoxin domain-containing protein [Sphingobium sufflavum]
MKRTSAQWDAAIIVCRKCSKKLGGGFGEKGKTSLAKALRAQADGGKGRKAGIGVVETGCLKICPENAVVTINGARPKDWLIVPKGSDIDVVAQRLGLGSKRD